LKSQRTRSIRNGAHHSPSMQIKPQYVKHMPDASEREDGILYISEEFGLAIHRCCCGCGSPTVTPISGPNHWDFTKNGNKVTLHPSIGNFSFPCKSHYWIRDNEVIWA